jgi:hypothetical protein
MKEINSVEQFYECVEKFKKNKEIKDDNTNTYKNKKM